MPYDDQGNWIEDDEENSPIAIADQEEQALSPSTPDIQEGKQIDIGEYIRRARLGGIGSGASLGSPYPEGESQGIVPTTGQTPGQELYKPGEKMSAYKTAIGQEPLHQDYHPSRWRSILGTIAGIGSGIAFGPNAGKLAQENIRDSPYKRQLHDYQQSLGVKGKEAQLEAGGNQAARQYYLDLAKVSHENAQSEAEKERRTAEAARGRRYDWMTSPQAHQYKLEETAAAHPGGTGALWSVTTKDGKKQVATAAPGGAFKVGDTLIPAEQVDPDKTKKLGVADPKTNVTNPFELWHQQNPDSPAEDFLKLNPRAQGEYAAYAADYKAAKPGASEREILRAFSADKEQPQKPPQAMAILPDGSVIKVSPGSHLPKGARTLNAESQINTPTSATRGRAQQAQAVIDTGQDLKQFITANRGKLGNIDDYWKNFVNGTPMSDPFISEFQTKLASYAALQAAAHSFRGSNVMTDFEHKIGGAQKNPDALIAAINGIESTMQELVKTGGDNYGLSGPSGNSLPGGVTLDEINAELARRKGKK